MITVKDYSMQNKGSAISPATYLTHILICAKMVSAKVLLMTLLLTTSVTSLIQARQIYTGSDGVSVTINDKSRIVSIGSAVTETIFALGAEEYLVAVDESSTYPAASGELPKVSFTRNLSAEGVLSMSPSLILASGAAGPQTAISQIRSTGTPMLLLTADETVQGAFERVRELGNVLVRNTEANKIITLMEADLLRAERLRNSLSSRPKVLFIYARGPNNLTVAGNGTSAKTMIELAGGINAYNSFDGYKPLTAEAVVEANPDIILMMKSGVESVGGTEGVLRAPGISLTSAGANNRIHAMEGTYLLGFGPRMGKAVLDLIHLFHPEIRL